MANSLAKLFLEKNPDANLTEDDITYRIGIENEGRLEEIAQKFPDFVDDYKRILDEVDPRSPMDVASDIGKGVARGAINTISQVPEAVGIAGHQMFGDMEQMPDNVFTNIAGGIREFAPERSEDPRVAGSFMQEGLPEGVGSGIGFIGMGGVTQLSARGALALAGRAGMKKATKDAALKALSSTPGIAVSNAALGAAANAPAGFRDALAHTDEIDTAYQSFWANAFAGTTEAVGIGRVGGKLFTRLDKMTDGKLKRRLKFGQEVGLEAVEEAAQEIIQGGLGDMIARDIVKYDPDRVMFEDIMEDAAIGGASGAIISAIVNSINRRANAIQAGGEEKPDAPEGTTGGEIDDDMSQDTVTPTPGPQPPAPGFPQLDPLQKAILRSVQGTGLATIPSGQQQATADETLGITDGTTYSPMSVSGGGSSIDATVYLDEWGPNAGEIGTDERTLSPAEAQDIAMSLESGVKLNLIASDVEESREDLDSTTDSREVASKINSRILTGAPLALPPGKELPDDVIDTRGRGMFFHGASQPINQLSSPLLGDHLNPDNIYGDGLYITDDIVTAKSYTKKNKRIAGRGYRPTIYQIEEIAPVKLYDLDAPLDIELYNNGVPKLTRENPDIKNGVESGEIKTLGDLILAAKKSDQYDESLSIYEIEEEIADISAYLMSMGYGGYKHTGGKLAGRGERLHSVRIYWDPENQIRIKEVNEDSIYSSQSMRQGPKLGTRNESGSASLVYPKSGSRISSSGIPDARRDPLNRMILDYETKRSFYDDEVVDVEATIVDEEIGNDEDTMSPLLTAGTATSEELAYMESIAPVNEGGALTIPSFDPTGGVMPSDLTAVGRPQGIGKSAGSSLVQSMTGGESEDAFISRARREVASMLGSEGAFDTGEAMYLGKLITLDNAILNEDGEFIFPEYENEWKAAVPEQRDREWENNTLHLRQIPPYIDLRSGMMDHIPTVNALRILINDDVDYDNAVRVAASAGASLPNNQARTVVILRDNETNKIYVTAARNYVVRTTKGGQRHQETWNAILIPKEVRGELYGIEQLSPNGKETRHEWVQANKLEETPIEIIGFYRADKPFQARWMSVLNETVYDRIFGITSQSAVEDRVIGEGQGLRGRSKKTLSLDMDIGDGAGTLGDVIGESDPGMDDIDKTIDMLQGLTPENYQEYLEQYGESIDLDSEGNFAMLESGDMTPDEVGSYQPVMGIVPGINEETGDVSPELQIGILNRSLEQLSDILYASATSADMTTAEIQRKVKAWLNTTPGTIAAGYSPEITAEVNKRGGGAALYEVVNERADSLASDITRIFEVAMDMEGPSTPERGYEAFLHMFGRYVNNGLSFGVTPIKQLQTDVENTFTRNRGIMSDLNLVPETNERIQQRFWEAVAKLRNRGLNVQLVAGAVESAQFIKTRNRRTVRLVMADLARPSLENWRSLIHEVGHAIMDKMPPEERLSIIKALQHASTEQFGIAGYEGIIDKDMPDIDLEETEDKLVEAAARLAVFNVGDAGLVKRALRAMIRAIKVIYTSAANSLHKALTGQDSPKAVVKYFRYRIEAALNGGTVTDFATWANGPIHTMFSSFRLVGGNSFSPIRFFNDGAIGANFVGETSAAAIAHNDNVIKESWDPNTIRKNRNVGEGVLENYDFTQRATQKAAQYIHVHRNIIEPFYAQVARAMAREGLKMEPIRIKVKDQEGREYEDWNYRAISDVTGLPKRSQPMYMLNQLIERSEPGLTREILDAVQQEKNPLEMIEHPELRQVAEKTINSYLDTIGKHLRERHKSPDDIQRSINQLESEIDEIKNGRLEDLNTTLRVIRRTASKMLKDFANKDPKDKLKFRSGATYRMLSKMYREMMGTKIADREDFDNKLKKVLGRFNPDAIAETVVEIGTILADNDGLFDGRDTDWRALHKLVLQKSDSVKALHVMKNDAFAAFLYSTFQKRPDIMVALEARRSGIDIRRLTALVSLQFSNRQQDLVKLDNQIKSMGPLGVKIGKALAHVAQKQRVINRYKRQLTGYKIAGTAYERVEIIDSQKARSDEALGIRAMVNSKGNTLTGDSWYEWQLTPGAHLINPFDTAIRARELTQKDHLVEFKDLLTDENLTRLNDIVANQIAWLGRNPNNTSGEARLLKYQNEQLMAFLAGQFRTDATKNWMQAFVGAPLERIGQINHPVAKGLVQALTKYETWSEKFASRRMANKIGTAWEKNYSALMKELKIKNRGQFQDRVLNLVLGYISKRDDISDKGELYSEAFNMMLRVAPDRNIDRPKARTALYQLLDQYAIAVDHRSKAMEEMGIKVEDEIITFEHGRKKMKKIARSHIGSPVQKVPRMIKPLMSGILEKTKSIMNQRGMPDFENTVKFWTGELNRMIENPEKEPDQIMLRIIEDVNSILSSDEIYESFVIPHFEQEVNNILTDEKVSTYHSDVGSQAVRGSTSILEAMSWLDKNATGISEQNKGVGFMTAGVMIKLLDSMRKLNRISESIQAEAGAYTMSSHRAIRHISMDARQVEDLPSEFLEFAQFSPTSVMTDYNILSLHAALGRDMVSWGKMTNELIADLSRYAKRYEAKRLSGKTDDQIRKELQQTQGTKEGNRVFELMKNAETFNKYVQSTQKAIDDFVTKSKGVPDELRFSNEMTGTLAGMTLQSIGSTITELSNIFVQPLVQYGPMGGFKGMLSAAKGTAARVFNSLMHAITGEVYWMEKIMKDYSEIGRGDDSTVAPFLDQFTTAMNTEDIANERNPVTRGLMRFNRAMRAGMSVGFARRSSENVTSVDSLQPLAPYSMFQNSMAFGVWYMNTQKFSNLIRDVAKLIDGKSMDEILKMKITPDMLVKSNPRWARIFNTHREAEQLLDMAGKYGIHVTYEAAKWLERKKVEPKAEPLTIMMKQQIGAMTAGEFTRDAGINTRNEIFINTTAGRIISPLFSWPFSQLSKIFGMVTPKTSDLKGRAAAIYGAAWPLVATMPIALVLSYLRDWYEEEALGKRSARPDVFNTDNPWAAFVERMARVGQFGFAGDVANRIFNPDPSIGVFDMGQSIYVFNLVNTATRSASEIWNSDFNATYPSFYRNLVQSFGGAGYMQYVQMMNKFMGLGNAEARATARIHVNNLIRLAGKANNLEIRPFAAGLSAPTPYKPYVKEMVDAAIFDDQETFMEAYRQAVDVARRDKNIIDPRKAILDSMTARHPLKGAFKRAITQSEYRKLLSDMDEDSRNAVQSSVVNFNKYLISIGGTAYTGSADTMNRNVRRVLGTRE